MSTKTDTEVIIAGKVFTLSGYESEEYLQKVASYINNKIAEYNKVDSFKRQSLDTKHELIASQIKLENMEKNIRNLQNEANENDKKIVRLETELKEKKK